MFDTRETPIMRHIKTTITAMMLLTSSATHSFALNQADKGVMNYAGMCTALAVEGNKILRAKGKQTNFDSIIAAANRSIQYIQNQPGAMGAYRGVYNVTRSGMKDYSQDAKVGMIAGMLAECAKQYGVN